MIITVSKLPLLNSTNALQAKGYPDYATKKFINLLSRECFLPIYYIGDADPFGADIYFNYAFGNQVTY